MILSEQEQDFVKAGIEGSENAALKQAAQELGSFDWSSELTPAALAVAIQSLADLRQRIEKQLAGELSEDEECWLVNDAHSIDLSLRALRGEKAVPVYSLDELLAQMTPENLHIDHEWLNAPAVGREFPNEE